MRVHSTTASGSGEPEATPSANGYAVPFRRVAAPALEPDSTPPAAASAVMRAALSKKMRRWLSMVWSDYDNQDANKVSIGGTLRGLRSESVAT